MFGLSQRQQEQVTVFIFAGIMSIAFYQFESNSISEWSLAWNIPELFIWVVWFMLNLVFIILVGAPVQFKNGELFINSFSGIQLLFSAYNIIVIVNDGIAVQLGLKLSDYYFILLLIFFLAFVLFFPTLARKQVRSARRRKT